MDHAFEAIKQLQLASPSLSGYTIVPFGVPAPTSPYVTYQLIDGRSGHTYRGTHELPVIQFDIWSRAESITELLTLYNTLTQVFDETETTVDGKSVSFRRTRYQQMKDPLGAWRYSIDYLLLID